MLGVRSKCLLPFLVVGIARGKTEWRADLLASRYQQLELKHVFDKGVCGAMEFR